MKFILKDNEEFTIQGTLNNVNKEINLLTLDASALENAVNNNHTHSNKTVLDGISSTDITNWNNKLDSYTETDPTVPNWAKQSTKPTYTASEVGALPAGTHIPSDVNLGSVAGKMYREDVNGTGNFTVRGNSGIIPTLVAGTYTVAIYAKSATSSYKFRFNFGSVSYELTSTNGIINDVRTITVPSGTFSGSVVAPTSGVASNTILSINMYNYQIPISTVGKAAVTNRYADLDGTPTIPTVNNGTLTIQKNGTNVATFTANQSGSSTANITIPTNVSELTNDAGYLKYQLLADEAAYEALTVKDSATLYLISESNA